MASPTSSTADPPRTVPGNSHVISEACHWGSLLAHSFCYPDGELLDALDEANLLLPDRVFGSQHQIVY